MGCLLLAKIIISRKQRQIIVEDYQKRCIFAENLSTMATQTPTLNQTQLHLLRMFSFCKTKSAMENIKKALMQYYAEAIDKEMDALWASGEMNDAKQESFKNGHFRTPYKK